MVEVIDDLASIAIEYRTTGGGAPQKTAFRPCDHLLLNARGEAQPASKNLVPRGLQAKDDSEREGVYSRGLRL